jgi:hypothetical protein
MQIIEIQTSVRGAVNDALARATVTAALVGVALIHMLQLPSAFDEVGYLGALFIAVVAASLVLATVLVRTSDERAWVAAGGLAGLVLLGYIISRSVGLPGFTDDVGEWSEPAGLASMVVESFVVLLAGGTLASGRFPVPGARRSAARAGTPASAGPAVG